MTSRRRIMATVTGVALASALPHITVRANDPATPAPVPPVVVPGSSPPAPLALAPGMPLPAFTAVTRDYALLSNDDLAGQSVLLAFFASWCPHCQAEAPRLAAAITQHPAVRVVMLAVADREAPDNVFAFGEHFALPFPTYWDGGRAARVVGVQAYPTLVVADVTGIVRSVDVGERTEAQLDALLAPVAP